MHEATPGVSIDCDATLGWWCDRLAIEQLNEGGRGAVGGQEGSQKVLYHGAGWKGSWAALKPM